MKYTIEIEYTTGDSFSTKRETSNLDLGWENLQIAEQNLNRIKEHWLWYSREHGHSWDTSPAPQKPKFVHDKWYTSLYLLLDDGTEFLTSSFWCGYFEQLHRIKIVQYLPEYEF